MTESEARELKKVAMLLIAMKEFEGEDKFSPLDELREASWTILHENPGSDHNDWRSLLLQQYPAEVVDAFGPDPVKALERLADWWDYMDYTDPDTGEKHTFREWAEYFATDQSVELYDLLAEARREIRRLEAH